MQFIRFYGSLQILSTMSFATSLRHALPTVILLGFRCSINYVDYMLSSNIRSFTSSISQLFLFVKLLETLGLIHKTKYLLDKELYEINEKTFYVIYYTICFVLLSVCSLIVLASSWKRWFQSKIENFFKFFSFKQIYIVN